LIKRESRLFAIQKGSVRSNNQLPAVPNPLNGNALARPTYQYEYNALGQMTKLIDANNRATQFQFDSTGRSTGRTLPLGNQESFAYDTRNRQLLQVTVRLGRTESRREKVVSRREHLSKTWPVKGTLRIIHLLPSTRSTALLSTYWLYNGVR